MFEKKYILDPGSFQCLFYSVSDRNFAAVRTCTAYHNDEILAAGTDAFRYIYKDTSYPIKYPIRSGKLTSSLYPILKTGLDQIKAGTSLLPSSCLVIKPAWMDSRFQKKLESELNGFHMKKIEFVDTSRLYQNDSCRCVIHAGHNYTEMHLYVEDAVITQVINLGGDAVHEKIKRAIAAKTRCIISDEDAASLCYGASEAFWNSKNRKLTCLGLNRYQSFCDIEVAASDLWEPIESVEKEILVWVKTNLKKIHSKDVSQAIRLSGGLARLFGLRQMLEQEFNCEVYCTKEPETDLVMNARVMK